MGSSCGLWDGSCVAIGNIEDLAGAMVQRDEAREGGGREGEGEKDLAIENIEDLAGAVVQRDEAREGGGREKEGEEGRGAGIKGATGWLARARARAVGCGLWAVG